MRASLTTILLTGLAGASACYGAGLLASHALLPQSSDLVQVLAGLGAGSAIVGLLGMVLLPTVSRQMAAIRERFAPGVDTVRSFSGPWWLEPVARTAREIASAWSTRCDELTVRLREAEIRHKVADAERRHCEGILHNLRDAVLVTDAFNELTLANEPAARLLGFDLGGASHRSIDDVIHDAALRQMIKEVRSSGVAHKEKHVEHSIGPQGEPGSSPTFDVTLAALPGTSSVSGSAQPGGVSGGVSPASAGTNGGGVPGGGEGQVGGVITILRDITREKEISRMKSDFVSQASHELRTPISAINAYAEMLLDAEAQDEPSRQEFYRIIKGEAERLSRMIDNMLNISRIEAGIVSVERTEVDFAKVMNEVVETMQAPAKEKNISLTGKAGPLIYTAEADRDLVYQVIMNLTSNSIKYTPAGGRVSVSVENDDSSRSVLVTVSDTGLGIPPDAIDKIFDKFYRIDNYKRVAKGTGLGLNLVKHIVETVHNGRVGVTSQVGMGSKFWFTIPYEYRGNA